MRQVRESEKIKQAIIENLSNIISASVKSMEAISEIKIIQVEGLTGGKNNHSEGNTGSPNDLNMADHVVNSALRYSGQAPLIDSILHEIGIKGGDINGLTNIIKNFTAQKQDEEAING